MDYDYLINVASALYIVCYIPELYANYKNKNANVFNIPEKVLMLLGTGFSLTYAVLNNNSALIINYGPLFALDIIAFLMRLHYVLKNCCANTKSVVTQTDLKPITVIVVSLD